MHAYRNLTTGRTVARAKIVELLDAQVQARGDRLARLTLDYKDGALDASTWLATMRDELRRAALECRSMAVGGWDKLTPHDYGTIGRALQDDYRRLIGFADDIASGALSEAQILNRLGMYLGSARVQFFLAQIERATPSKPGLVVLGKRVLGISEHCPSCVVYARASWQPIANVIPPGLHSECMTNCRCSVVTREVPIAEAAALVGSGLRYRTGTRANRLWRQP